MAIPGPRKNFLKAVSISAVAHIAAVGAVLACLAPVPAVLLPFNEDQGVISVSLVGGAGSGAGGEKAKEIKVLSRQEKQAAVQAAVMKEVKKEPPVSEKIRENVREEAKNKLTGEKFQLSYAALDVYTNGHSTYSDRTNGSPEKAAGQNNGRGAHNGTAGSGSSEGVKAPLLIPAYRQNNPPRYPVTARLRGYEGLVLVSAEILADGTVGSIKVKRSSGYAVLDDSAVKAVKKWIFQPGQRLGVAVSMWVDVPIRFALNE